MVSIKNVGEDRNVYIIMKARCPLERGEDALLYAFRRGHVTSLVLMLRWRGMGVWGWVWVVVCGT
jgi:hypothetical protein